MQIRIIVFQISRILKEQNVFCMMNDETNGCELRVKPDNIMINMQVCEFILIQMSALFSPVTGEQDLQNNMQFQPCIIYREGSNLTIDLLIEKGPPMGGQAICTQVHGSPESQICCCFVLLLGFNLFRCK